VIELLTGLVFVGLFAVYFRTGLRDGMNHFLGGGWFIYGLHLTLLAAFIAASAIDLELWVIPLSICWLVTAVGLIGSAAAGYVIDPSVIHAYSLLPRASAGTGALAAGAAIGLGLSWVLLASGLIKRSYESEESEQPAKSPNDLDQRPFHHRLEICREIVFLLPVVVCAVGAFWITRDNGWVHARWVTFSQHRVVAGFLGSALGYFVGCAVVWATRIFGTLAFGKEAMGLGDVHLMGAAGAVVGPVPVVAAFFVAPFFGLAWAGFQMFFKKTRQIPYGPFLSLGVLVVMILHDWIFSYWDLITSR
jgi:leader peptidase (prepilin peptidase)/N-methyltransferase